MSFFKKLFGGSESGGAKTRKCDGCRRNFAADKLKLVILMGVDSDDPRFRHAGKSYCPSCTSKLGSEGLSV